MSYAVDTSDDARAADPIATCSATTNTTHRASQSPGLTKRLARVSGGGAVAIFGSLLTAEYPLAVPGDVGEQHEVLPYVTVVMPIRNEARSIATSLAAVLGQDYPSHRFEVIVADGMSNDGTRAAIDAVVEAAGCEAASVTIIDNPRGVVATGLNAAISKAKGDLIVRVDGHCEVEHDYVTTCVRLLEETGADNVGGITAARGTGVLQRAIALGMSSPFGVGNARFRYASKPGWVDTVFPGAWRREVFERIGGFDEELVRNQDDEHNFRLVQAGGRIWLDPGMRIRYEPRDSVSALWRQYFDYGFHKVRVIQKRRGIGSLRHVIPSAFVVSILTGVATAAVTRRRKLVLAVAVPYAAASVVASAHAGRSDRATLPVLPIVFATLHLSYGAGFLAGLWSWCRRRT
jgi:succinoglycan biosynthesis protein ExoA